MDDDTRNETVTASDAGSDESAHMSVDTQEPEAAAPEEAPSPDADPEPEPEAAKKPDEPQPATPEPEAPAAPAKEEEPSETAKKEHDLIEAALAAEEDEEWTPETQILVLKTQVGQERRVAENLAGKAKRFGIPIHSLLAPQELRGYVFIETPDVMAVEKGIRGVSYARALIKDPDGQPRDTPFTEIQHFLTPVSAVAKIGEGDIVELVSGPFRGEKAKVTRVDDAREEITVELIESMVPIPITVKGEHVRVLQKSS